MWFTFELLATLVGVAFAQQTAPNCVANSFTLYTDPVCSSRVPLAMPTSVGSPALEAPPSSPAPSEAQVAAICCPLIRTLLEEGCYDPCRFGTDQASYILQVRGESILWACMLFLLPKLAIGLSLHSPHYRQTIGGFLNSTCSSLKQSFPKNATECVPGAATPPAPAPEAGLGGPPQVQQELPTAAAEAAAATGALPAQILPSNVTVPLTGSGSREFPKDDSASCVFPSLLHGTLLPWLLTQYAQPQNHGPPFRCLENLCPLLCAVPSTVTAGGQIVPGSASPAAVQQLPPYLQQPQQPQQQPPYLQPQQSQQQQPPYLQQPAPVAITTSSSTGPQQPQQTLGSPALASQQQQQQQQPALPAGSQVTSTAGGGPQAGGCVPMPTLLGSISGLCQVSVGAWPTRALQTPVPYHVLLTSPWPTWRGCRRGRSRAVATWWDCCSTRAAFNLASQRPRTR